MPWKPSGLMEERIRFVLTHQGGLWSVQELCARFGISRRVGYKWLHRYEREGIEGLKDRSRAPLRSPQRLAPELEALLVEARRAHPHWGPRKILAWLVRRRPEMEAVLPAASTLGAILHRHGLVQPRKKRRSSGSMPTAGALQTDAPNEVWSADFKGEFRLGNGHYCYPFTLADAHTRFLLSCRAEASTSLAGAKQGLIEAFRSYGLPEAIRTDNGTPFVGHGATGLSSLGVWWIKLGIRHQRIPKARPDQNGRHERMHRTLKAETTRPPESSFSKQQQRFDMFLSEFNQERPHEALEQQTPASRFCASTRPYPDELPTPDYPSHFQTRKVARNGMICFREQRYFIAHPLSGEWLGFIEIAEDLWSIRYYDHELGRLNPREGTLSLQVLPMSPV